ncbi:hypothetical protein GGP96_000308 [Salinibacter ruber]|nr:hypothetical protein [Salinibacter ruber]MCS4175610.1 hypothetical protein [Salinibacter ruber]MCS4197863.1 hypothetical protein [Salinibacter ruber]
MRCCCYCLLLVLLVPTLTGCAGSSEIAQPPTRLSEINRVLESSDATIVWVSGNRVKDAEYVRLSRDSIRYRLHTDPGGASRWESSRLPESEKTRSRPIEDAQRIETLVGGGVVSGSAISAIPGGIVIGTSLVSGSELGVRYGTITALACGAIGAVFGLVADMERRVVYRRPVSRYLK